MNGANVVDMLITDLAVFKRANRSAAFRLIDLAPGVTLDDVRARTEAHFE